MPMRDALPRNQALVLDALRADPGRALTAYALLTRLGPAGMRGPQTVYRALDGLLKSGLIHRIESLNAFIACTHAHGEDGHAHHGHRPAFAVCRSCGAVRELDDPALAAVLGVVADRSGFAVQDRVIELVGACAGCAAAGA
jgi:Fur family zinc uptake transcriptional regulator